MKRWIRLASRLYPYAWRARYGAELDALLDDAGLQWGDLLDVIRGAATMQITAFMSYWKMAALAGLAGAVLAGAIAFSIHNQYVCNASLILQSQGPDSSTQALRGLNEATLKVLGRDSLIGLITSPDLDLYPQERSRYPVEDIAEKQMRKNLHVVPLLSDGASGSQAFRIGFQYPDRVKAQRVVAKVVSAFITWNAQQSLTPASAPMTLKLLEAPITPDTPAAPNRLAIMLIGLFGGALTGLLSLKLWRHKASYSVLTTGLPAEARQFLESQVAAGSYRDAGEYIRELIRADQEKKAAR